ncbi:MAG: hypothetical protein ABIA04_04690 [Pseudomonadota bacterium]
MNLYSAKVSNGKYYALYTSLHSNNRDSVRIVICDLSSLDCNTSTLSQTDFSSDIVAQFIEVDDNEYASRTFHNIDYCKF